MKTVCLNSSAHVQNNILQRVASSSSSSSSSPASSSSSSSHHHHHHHHHHPASLSHHRRLPYPDAPGSWKDDLQNFPTTLWSRKGRRKRPHTPDQPVSRFCECTKTPSFSESLLHPNLHRFFSQVHGSSRLCLWARRLDDIMQHHKVHRAGNLIDRFVKNM